jgi:hypothetical protein
MERGEGEFLAIPCILDALKLRIPSQTAVRGFEDGRNMNLKETETAAL